jgi:DNA transposition AAA+ family ATPase
MTPSYLLKTISNELGILGRGSNAAIFDSIVQRLKISRQAIVIDEFDTLLGNRRELEMVDGLRQLQDAAGVPLVAVGEEKIESKLDRYGRFLSRIIRRVEFGGISELDGLILASELVQGISIGRELVVHLLKKANYGIREYCVMLSQAEDLARNAGLSLVSLEDWKVGVRLPEGREA